MTNTFITGREFFMNFVPQDIPFVPFILFDVQHFLHTLLKDFSEMSFQAVLIHRPITAASDGVMFPAGVNGRSQIAVIPHTANIVCEWFVNYHSKIL
jgi:hypothetical protein